MECEINVGFEFPVEVVTIIYNDCDQIPWNCIWTENEIKLIEWRFEFWIFQMSFKQIWENILKTVDQFEIRKTIILNLKKLKPLLKWR